MAGAWETDDEYLGGPAGISLPAPENTPYRTPSAASRRSRRSVTPPGTSSSPPPLPSERADKMAKRTSKDITTDETISILDPRRFTPTLHANLVSEILALRRDQEEKTRQIDALENTLQNTKTQQEFSQENALAATKENRSLKRQLNLLEGGTSSAFGELSKERDEATDALVDTKKRLDAAQKKVRSQDEDSQRVHELWAQEKDGWFDERRKYERKLHVAESRLKAVLEEVSAFQAAHANENFHGTGARGNDSDVEDHARDQDAASVRTMSMTNSIRHSLINVPGAPGKLNGHSLADELDLDGDDDESESDVPESAPSSPEARRHVRQFSRDSIPGRMHLRNQSLDSLKRPVSVGRSKLFQNQSVLEALEGEQATGSEATTAPRPSYTDTGIQFSPPPSPLTEESKPLTPEPPNDVEPMIRQDSEIEANQSRKRVQLSPAATPSPPPPMISAASQTVEEPMSPPKIPKSPTRAAPVPPVIKTAPTCSSSTQTEEPVPISRTTSPAQPLPPPVPVPSISVQPPTSRPTTPREPRLPEYFKHFGCQVNLTRSTSVSLCDASVQTEGIQIDKRLALLPPHLQPSSISSRPSSPVGPPATEPDQHFTPVPNHVPPRNPRRLNRRSDADVPSSPLSNKDENAQLHDAYPGNNDDGPLSEERDVAIKRPHRFSSLFAGFDTASSDEADEFGDADLSDSEYRTALSAPRPLSTSSAAGKRSSAGTAPTSPDQPTLKSVARNSIKGMGTETYSSFSLSGPDNSNGKLVAKSGRVNDRSTPPPVGQSSRASIMRKAAMIQSGIASEQGRPRSPSLPDTRNPPFPIPTRASSRRPPWSSSAPSDGPRSPTSTDFWYHRRSTSRSSYRTNSIRKVRSAAALPRNQRYRRQGSRSPPPLSPSTEAPESPNVPPMPRNDITTPLNQPHRNSHYRKHKHEVSTNTDNTAITDPRSAASTGQTSGVVDAIAQTMVGEWMFKYVRRRKSFGVPESSAKDDGNNDRHKRWVWLAPYERAILWSSKQPSSGSALMGKTGRKLIIQSVLDVKDDNPTPKGALGVFNRSILILTPQRALKFTAVSSERHYIWLTALSFLAHSSQAVPEIPTLPLPSAHQQPLPDFEGPARPKAKRPGIRDSIRLAKGRTANSGAATPNVPSAAPSIPSIPSAPASSMGEVVSYRGRDSTAAGSRSDTQTPETSRDAAEAPYIPRFHDRASGGVAHGRKRSNTGGHIPPPVSFRGYAGPTNGASGHNPSGSTAGASIGTADSSDIYQSQLSSNTTWGMSQTASQRTSEVSSRPSNFFDAIGTVRMEAFISPLGVPQFGEVAEEQTEVRQLMRRRSKEMRRRSHRRRESHNSRGTRATDDYTGGSRTIEEGEYFRDDPFRGF